MTAVTVNNRHLTIIFPGWKRLMTRRRFYSVPLEAISARQVTEWTFEFLGLRYGLAIPGVRTLGTYRHPDAAEVESELSV